MAETSEELVLHDLGKLTICDKSDGRLESVVTKKSKTLAGEIVTLSKAINLFENSKFSAFATETSEHYVFKYTIQHACGDQPKVIQLAFPINTAAIQPNLSGSSSWLPLQRLPQVQIRILSDFSNATSLDVSPDRNWNNTLLDEIAHAFAGAITEFATKDHPLRYSWLKSLPDQCFGHPWDDLYRKIIGLLKDKPILQTQHGRIFRRPYEVNTIPFHYLHQGTPILDDLPDELYLVALEYDSVKAASIFKDLGVRNISRRSVLNRLEADLKNTHSKMKSLAADDAWHISCANMLLQLFKPPHEATLQRLQSMDIIPVRSIFGFTRWTKPPTDSSTTQPTGNSLRNDGEVYFPSTSGVPIPHFSSLCFVEAQAASVPKRAALFRALGVKDCPKKLVLDAIRKFHEEIGRTGFLFGGKVFSNTEEEDLMAQFRYLFHFDTSPESLKTWLLVPTEGGYLRKTSDRFYFPSDHDCAQQLLKTGSPKTITTIPSLDPSSAISGPSSAKDGRVAFLSKTLVRFVPSDIRCHGLSWREWLTMATGARNFPPLFENEATSELSPIFVAMASRGPENVVGLLQANWKAEYESVISNNSWIRSKLGDLSVMCESNTTCQLRHTYLPTNDLKTKTRELGVEGIISELFLKLPVALDSTDYQDWEFLEDFGVGTTADMSFYKLILEKMRNSELLFSIGQLINIYGCVAQMSQKLNEQDQNELRDYFAQNEVIYDNNTNELTPRTASWVTSEDCVWRGPDEEWFGIRNTLEKWYRGHTHLENFFSAFLGIQDCGIEEVLDELEALRKWSGTSSLELATDQVRDIYRYLDATIQSDAEWASIRCKFNKHQLVFTGGLWYAVSSCLWTNRILDVGPQVGQIGPACPELEKFFVKRLGVKIAPDTTPLPPIPWIPKSSMEMPKPKDLSSL
ncbi:uncharacterized protein BDZ99DRAFT_502108 [Mytilinidion resinicola]|uniref:Uncharacterized protein n=1 Tax=Mytilinidion resinicola TaxID=574789 RepID=A0A6A6YBP1_9PEZI|nr:uncharacterized protein BDZ99DRAFT_502108 [Mytilinidion resinicola]KAF2805257.1 hypothetical protein BDZ99DRAFT_502108 [Mytilinidion resinicola]